MIDRLNELVNDFPGKRVLVVGDLMVDEFIWGSVSRVSPEAPVPVVLEKKREKRPGGALNVVSNLVSLGAAPFVAGITGADESGKFISSYLESSGIETCGITPDPLRPTTIKTRVIGNNQQIVRLDSEKTEIIDSKTTQKIIDYIELKSSEVSAVIISDYNKGIINEKIINCIKSLHKKKNIFTAVDPQVRHYKFYNGFSLITPNHHEAGAFIGISIDDEKSIHDTAGRIMDDISPEILLITLGEKGMMLYSRDRKFIHVPTVAKHVYDVSGAGDTVISVFTLSMTCGASPVESAVLANIAAGYVVGEMGTTSIPLEILKKSIKPEYIPV